MQTLVALLKTICASPLIKPATSMNTARSNTITHRIFLIYLFLITSLYPLQTNIYNRKRPRVWGRFLMHWDYRRNCYSSVSFLYFSETRAQMPLAANSIVIIIADLILILYSILHSSSVRPLVICSACVADNGIHYLTWSTSYAFLAYSLLNAAFLGRFQQIIARLCYEYHREAERNRQDRTMPFI